jgi:FkbM family methyltransferase
MTMSLTSYAQNFEDVMLARALGDIEHGFYVDVGAGHPQLGSVTHAFYQRGWRGINVEPAVSLQALLRSSRPADVTLGAAAGASAGSSQLFELPGTLCSTQDEAGARGAGSDIVRRQVEQLTLDQVLQAQAPAVIHFLNIDTNGAEAAALAGLDLQRWRPWIVLVDTAAGTSWEARLLAARYSLAHDDGQNRYYVAAEQAPLAERLRLPPHPADDFVLCEDHPYSHPLAHWRERVALAEATSKESREWAIAHVREWREKAAGGERAERLAAELGSAESRAASAEALLAVLRPRLAHAESEVAALHASLSWRLTRPLRLASVLARRALGFARRQPGRAKRALLRLVKGTAQGALRFVIGSPRLAFFLRRQVSRFPFLVRVLRTAVLRMQASQASAEVDADLPPIDLSQLPSGARQVFADLHRAARNVNHS